MKIRNFKQLMNLAIERDLKTIAVASPESIEILEVIERAEKINLAKFVLIGDSTQMEQIIKENNLIIKAEIIDEKDQKNAANLAVELVAQGKATTVMKGMLHSSVFLKAVLNKEKTLNVGKRITQVSILEKDDDGLMFITDSAITVNPDLLCKIEVLENAVDLAHKLGIEKPRVAILASLEDVNPNMQDTIDAAVLSKMSERGQIKGCIVDGPLAFDNAVSVEAAKAKGISGPVAGNADIIVVPNLTVGNAVSKAIGYIGKKTLIGATVGTSVPIVFTSRTESFEGKLLSIALVAYLS